MSGHNCLPAHSFYLNSSTHPPLRHESLDVCDFSRLLFNCSSLSLTLHLTPSAPFKKKKKKIDTTLNSRTTSILPSSLRAIEFFPSSGLLTSVTLKQITDGRGVAVLILVGSSRQNKTCAQNVYESMLWNSVVCCDVDFST